MATWGLHMRIAESVLKNNFDLDEAYFLVGNIGPDCGVPNEDWSQFTPPTKISHWSNGGKSDIQADRFMETHLKDPSMDHKKKSFMMGYYVHLLTDIAFSNFLSEKKEKSPDYEPLKSDPAFIWTIKKDWYDLDHKYFRDHPDNIFQRVFQHVKNFPDYLDYYPAGAVQGQVDYITKYYSNPSENLDRDYQYLTEEEMNRFVDVTINDIVDTLYKEFA